MNRLKVITLAGLALLDLAAGAFALNAWTREPDDASVAPRGAPPLAPAAASGPPPDAETAATETLGRPLFVKSRRPSLDGPKAGPAAPPPTGMKLRAVVTIDEAARAYLVAEGSAEGQWLRVGDELNSWTVERISRREIALRRDEETVAIGFDDAEAPAPRAAAPPP
ncbi:hypothetical protein CCR94_13560, partial [Rhodoblastus sphagnicola]